MTKSSNHSENISSSEIERQVRDVISRARSFKTEVDGILIKFKPPPVREERADQIIQNLFLRFHLVAKQICERHEDRQTLIISDEYDVQDLLHALLKEHFDDIRPEEWTPSYAGGSSRTDFLLKNEQIFIEVKKTRKGLDAKKLGDELIVDKAHYKTHPDCKTLYCLVYDPEDMILNPRGFERDLSEKIGDFETKVFIVPKRV